MNRMIRKTGYFLIMTVCILAAGCGKTADYDPVESLVVEKAVVKVYFDPDPNVIAYNSMKGRTPDPSKHRVFEYFVIVSNSGGPSKESLVADIVVPEELKPYIVFINPGTDPRDVVENRRGTLSPYPAIITEGPPEEMEKYVAQSQVEIVWAEGGQKYKKIVNVTLEK